MLLCRLAVKMVGIQASNRGRCAALEFGTQEAAEKISNPKNHSKAENRKPNLYTVPAESESLKIIFI